MLIKNIFGYNTPRASKEHELFLNKTKVGIEIELEGVNPRKQVHMQAWDITHDNSLRNKGYEFVSSRPLNGNLLYSALNSLFSKEFIKEADPSWRCGIHVHIDARMWDLEMLKKFMIVYLVNERKVFSEINSSHRMNSNFCTPIQYCDRLLHALFKTKDVRTIPMAWNKYTAMNLIPLATQGSVEWRGSCATTNKEDVVKLLQRLYGIIDKAEELDMGAIIDYARKENPVIHNAVVFYSER